jgi:hypothetical protein
MKGNILTHHQSPATAAPRPFELGLYTFVENLPNPATGALTPPAERMRHLIETAELADQVGLDVFGIGEHHRTEYLASAPLVILGALAARTRRIRLSTAVTVLSSGLNSRSSANVLFLRTWTFQSLTFWIRKRAPLGSNDTSTRRD